MSTINVKLQVASELRRFSIESKINFIQLKEKVKSILGIDQDFSIQYLDEEKEWITITSDPELNTGISLIDKIFRLQVVAIKPLNLEKEDTCSNEDKKCRKGWKKEWKGERRERGGRGCGRKRYHHDDKTEEIKDEVFVDDKTEKKDDKEEQSDFDDDCSGKRRGGKEWKKGRRGCRKNQFSDKTEKKDQEEQCDLDNDCSSWKKKGGRKEWKKEKGYGKRWSKGGDSMQNECDVFSSESGDEKLTLDEIKKETSSIVEELKLLKEKKLAAVDELKKN